MTIEKLHDGSLLISDIVGSQLVKQKYMGYTKREAIRKFKQYLKSLQHETSKH